jgi:hypothetical protein
MPIAGLIGVGIVTFVWLLMLKQIHDGTKSTYDIKKDKNRRIEHAKITYSRLHKTNYIMSYLITIFLTYFIFEIIVVGIQNIEIL